MRQFITLILVIFSISSYAQNENEEKIFTKVEVEAQFPGGKLAWNTYFQKILQNKMNELKVDGQAGTVRVRFVVDTVGNVSDFTAETMERSLLSKIVIDAIIDGPKWIPATQNGQKVKAWCYQTVTYTLPEE